MLERYFSTRGEAMDVEAAIMHAYQGRYDEAVRLKSGGEPQPNFKKEIFDRIRRQLVRFAALSARGCLGGGRNPVACRCRRTCFRAT